MIVGIRGKVEVVGPDWLVADLGEVSLKISVPAPTLSRVRPGQQVHLYTYLRVREDDLSLYGFLTQAELGLFEAIIGVSGVGAKLALSLLSTLTPEQIVAAVAAGDTEALARAPGIGKKVASRLALELKGKLEGEWRLPTAAGDGSQSEVVSALTALGYTGAEAARAAASVAGEAGLTVEERISRALAYFRGG